MSYEPWGWLPYHYGSWDWDAGFGWYWSPGAYYSPAWVYWSYTPSWVGWCPIGYYGGYYGGHYGAATVAAAAAATPTVCAVDTGRGPAPSEARSPIPTFAARSTSPGSIPVDGAMHR